MSSNQDFNQQLYQSNTLKLRKILADLPDLCGEFIRGIEPTTSILTRIAYAYDLKVFFDFLSADIEEFKGKSPTSFDLEDLNRVTPTHIEIFLEYLSYYVNDQDELKNTNPGKARKLSSLRSLFSYFYKKQKLDRNVTSLVDLPKIYEKPIIRLEIDEVAKLLDAVESGEGLTKTQKRYHKYTKSRDLAILTLFLGTGIRISECVGLNMDDFDFNVNGFKITRKGGNQVILYFSDEVKDILVDYIEERKNMQPLPGHEQALFLSLQRRRISKRAVQNLVKKYSSQVTQLKNISPHKLRSTYGTNLYRETGDIYLVADVLGHKDVNTTKKHYAAISDDKRRQAARMLKLRD
ncbi:MAG: tyrosine-type recombinase/integrase [Clostridia bacterium]|nr:tyrosine-type recombinase/integrase [Clostridia bacterium]